MSKHRHLNFKTNPMSLEETNCQMFFTEIAFYCQGEHEG